jgi:hypothetical protein
MLGRCSVLSLLAPVRCVSAFAVAADRPIEGNAAHRSRHSGSGLLWDRGPAGGDSLQLVRGVIESLTSAPNGATVVVGGSA